MKMRNMKVSGKLLYAFAITIGMSIVVGLTGIIGMRTINSSMDALYFSHTQPLGDVAKAVFIADKIEFSRQGTGGAQARFREIAAGQGNAEDKTTGLTELFYAVLKNNVRWLKEKGIEASEESLRLLEEKPDTGTKQDRR